MSQTHSEDLRAEPNDASQNRPAPPTEAPDTIDPVVDILADMIGSALTWEDAQEVDQRLARPLRQMD